jgi:hypothetical protein
MGIFAINFIGSIMYLMNKISKKTTPIILLAALLLIVGGFCNGSIASASAPKQEAVVEVTNSTNDCTTENNVVEKAKPISNTLMPCCVERKNNSDAVVPTISQHRINFSQALMTKQVALADNAIDQKIYPSSPSPPPEAENISCTVKIE